MAEVLITLGIIGVVAAMTMPSLITNYQENVRRQQFKKAYNVLNNALQKTKASLDYVPECYSHMSDSDRPPGIICRETNSYGTCISFGLSDGSPLPADTNGYYNDCSIFRPAFLKEFSIVKTCATNGFENGCMPEYKGTDGIAIENDPSANPDPGTALSTANFKKRPAYVLADGTILVDLYTGGWVAYAVDINGFKKPNKWGYDLFSFGCIGSKKNGSVFSSKNSMGLVEKGGKSTAQMLDEIYK